MRNRSLFAAAALMMAAFAGVAGPPPAAQVRSVMPDFADGELCAVGQPPPARAAAATMGDVLRAEAIPRVVKSDFAGTIRVVVEVAGNVDTIDVDTVVLKGGTYPRRSVQRLVTASSSTGTISAFEFTQTISLPDITTTGQPGTISWGDFTAILFRIAVAGENKGTATTSVVPARGLPVAPVRRIDDRLQYSSHVINVRSRGEIEGRISATTDIAPQADELLRETVYRHFQDVFDQTVLVTSYGFTWRFGGYWDPIRNAIGGIGRAVNTTTAPDLAGSRVRQGRILIRDTVGSNLLLHEIAHQWADAFNWLAIAGQAAPDVPHTPLWGHFESPVSYKLPLSLFLSPRGETWTVELAAAPVFPPLYRYAMGRTAKADVPAISFLDDQAQPLTDRTAAGSVRTVTINDVVRVHGERTGPVVDRWRVALIVLTPDRLLSDEEMAFYNYWSQRASDPSGETWLVPTFEKMTGATLDTAVRPLDAEALTASAFDPVPSYAGRDLNLMTIDPFPSVLLRTGRYDLRGLVDRRALDLMDIREISLRFTPAWSGTPHTFSGAVNSSGAFAVAIDPSTMPAGRYTAAVIATRFTGRTVLEGLGTSLDILVR